MSSSRVAPRHTMKTERGLSVLVSVLVVISLTVSVSAVATKSSTEVVRYQKVGPLSVSSFPYNQGFEGTTFPPTDWTRDSANWVQNSTNPRTGTYCAAGTIVTTGDDTRWFQVAVNFLGYYNVGVSLYNRVTTDTTHTLFSLRGSTNGGTSWFTIKDWLAPGSTTAYTLTTADTNLSNFDDQSNCAIRIRAKSTDGSQRTLKIDDFSITANIIATAPTVTTNAATNVEETTATLNGDVTSDGGATITERGFYCDTDSSPSTKYTVSGTTGAYTKDMTGLSPGTKYYFKAFATNSVGTSYGSILDFTTIAAGGATATATGPTGSTDNTSVTLTYTYTGSPTSVKLYYTKNAGTSWTLAGEDTSVDGTFSYSITSGDGTYGWIAVTIGGGSTETDPPAGGTSPEASPLILDTTPAGSGDYWVDDPTDAPVDGGYGEAIVGAQGKIYLTKTYNAISQDYFYAYNPATNAWSSQLSVSGLPGGGTGDFRNGAALVWDNGNYIYSLLGGRYDDADGNRYFFYRYSISSNSWTAMASTPTSIGQQTAGGALAWIPGRVLEVSDDNYIYACLGDHSNSFARYSIKTDSWTIMAHAPGRKDDGCSLVWTGDNYLFALQGEYVELGYNDAAWRYNIISNTWDLTGKFATDVGDGGSMIWTSGDYIYATSGCSSDETLRDNFYRYNFKTGLLRQTDWVPLADLPEKIGDFVGCRIGFTWTSVGSSVGDIYGWRGVSGSYKFWGYIPPIPITSWTQTDWKGGPTKPTLQVGKWSENYDNFYDNENVNWSRASKIMLENAPAPPPPGIADHVVISEFATRGPGENDSYDEFVELYNPTSSDINIGGLVFEYYDGSNWSYSYYGVYIGTIPSDATIPAHGFYLWGNLKGYSGSVLPDWGTYGKGLKDDTPVGSARGIRLIDNITTDVFDTVVFEADGNTDNAEAEGGLTAPNQGASLTNSVERKAQSTSTADSLFEPDGADATNGNGYDSDNNYNDWVRQTNGRNPENSASPLEYPLSVTFKSAGWFESSIYDAGELADWKSVFWSESKPSGTDIIVRLRTGGDSNPYDGGWSGWYQHTNHTENTLMENRRYVQYRVELSTTDNTTTPQLFDILISYDINIDDTAPPTPALVSPSNGAVLSDSTPTFDWTSVSDPSGVTYDIQVDNDPDFSSPEVNVAGLTDNTYTSPALAYENYSWRVRAVDGASNIGDWSDVWQFTCVQFPHGRIYIRGNENFTPANGVTGGSGTVDDPYVIEGWEIDASVAGRSWSGAIDINETDAYFIIQNCYIHGGQDNNYSLWSAIKFADVWHGTIRGTVIDNVNTGILIYDNGPEVGVPFSAFNIIDGNIIENSYEGIKIYGDPTSYIINNTVRNINSSGIATWGSMNVVVRNNVIDNVKGNSGFGGGILVNGGADNILIENNTITNSGLHGMDIYYCYNITVRYNNIENSAQYGFRIKDGKDPDNVRIYLNNIRNSGQTPQGYVMEANFSVNENVVWDNGTHGNYWSDWTTPDANGDGIVDNPYILGGASGNWDSYPLTQPYETYLARSGGRKGKFVPLIKSSIEDLPLCYQQMLKLRPLETAEDLTAIQNNVDLATSDYASYKIKLA